MKHIIHFTSNKKLEDILRVRRLYPFSKPFNEKFCKLTAPGNVNLIFPNQKYLVGLGYSEEDNAVMDKGWIEYGLLDYLLKHTSKEVMLKVPIIDKNSTFVRDFSCWSPKKTLEAFGENLFTPVIKGELDIEDERVQKCIANYINSTVSLKDYLENPDYIAPEFWLPQVTPLGLITKINQY